MVYIEQPVEGFLMAPFSALAVVGIFLFAVILAAWVSRQSTPGRGAGGNFGLTFSAVVVAVGADRLPIRRA